MIHKTAIDGLGIFQLGMVQDFFKKMKIQISEVQVNGEYFDLQLSQNQIRNLTRFNKIPSQSFLTKFNRKGFGMYIEFSLRIISKPFLRFHNLISDKGLCPVVQSKLYSAGFAYPHALVIDKHQTVHGEMVYSCKNTNKSNRKVNVGYSLRADIHPLIEAIIIQFEKK